MTVGCSAIITLELDAMLLVLLNKDILIVNIHLVWLFEKDKLELRLHETYDILV